MRKKLTYLILSLCLIAAAACSDTAAAAPRPLTLTLECGGHTLVYTDSRVAPTNHLIAEEIEKRKLNAPFAEKLARVDAAIEAGAAYSYALQYCFPRIGRALTELKKKAETEAADSRLTFDPDRRPMFVITKEKEGRSIDEEQAYKSIYIALKRCAVKGGTDAKAEIGLTAVRPKTTTADNVKLTAKRSEFSTRVDGSTEARKHNVALALKKINGTVLQPGEEFSFNAAVGPRTAENGFLEAKIIMSGEYIKGLGGGVCQASTTLYNGALLADMKITAVRNHSLEASYVSPSFDAMVNAGSSDLSFINEGKTPVFIRAYCDGHEAKAEFYGCALPYRIVPESVVLKRGEVPADSEIIDAERKYVGPAAPAGERVRVSYGKARTESEGYLSYYTFDNRLIRRVKIRSDVYAAHTGIIAVAP